MEFRVERDSMGEIKVESNRLWGAQTQRSLGNFKIGKEKMPQEIIEAFAILKAACAKANVRLGKMDEVVGTKIYDAAMKISEGEYGEEFPLAVWQTGSGTQTNMNLNEVISHIVSDVEADTYIHPNDHVNMSQSSNDTFPTAMHIGVKIRIMEDLIPALEGLIETFDILMRRYDHILKIGRTHLQDAVPMSFGQEISGWKALLELDKEMITQALEPVSEIPIGGTAIGTGINSQPKFGEFVCEELANITGYRFSSMSNKFAGLSGKSPLVNLHGALKALAGDMWKIAGDIRWLASGPRGGIGEITIPSNEPGSSIMPGKVNPTQCEAVSMVACQVMGNDTTVGIAASQGNFQLNTYMPVIAYNVFQTINLLSDGITSFNDNCCKGIKPKEDIMKNNLERSLMLVTALNPHVGYDNGAKIAKTAYEENITLREAAIKLNILTGEEFDELVRPEDMV